MLVGETVQGSLSAIRSNKLRSLLTMLGIIIGVAAVITMIALGTGAQKSVQDRIKALGPDLLTLYPGQMFRMGVASDTRVSLTVDDADVLGRDAKYVKAVVPELARSQQVSKGETNINTSIVGTTANYPEVRGFGIAAGRMFTPGDNESRRRYAVLGGAIPAMLDANPVGLIGQNIEIRGIQFEVIGVLTEKGSQGGGFQNPDEQILIPLDTARYRVMGTDRLRSVTVQASDVNDMNLTMIEIERVLRREHKIRPGQDDDFMIRGQTDILATYENTAKTFTRLLAGIAIVSLIVGGIGIMNIMLVSVTERTKEIGVRKAIGATRGNILVQFLIEALVLCLAGGIMGIIFGSGGAILLSKINHWNTLISVYAILLAFTFSAVVGIVFGMWPARRAALMNPVEALRQE
jgi:putative ABC transport system permease protein